MEQPKYSIIVPVYGVEKYIYECLDSLRRQTYGNYEVILVDDGSPDRSGEICDEYAVQDGRFRVIHKENGGLVSARKAGAEACTGDYVVNVDSDDYITDDLLERLTAIIVDHEPDVVIYDGCRFTEGREFDWNGNMPVGIYRGGELKKIHEALILGADHQLYIRFNLVVKAIRRALYIRFQMPVPNRISRGEDLAVSAPLLAQCESVYISDIHGYYYRDNPTSIMNTFKKTEPQQIIWVAEYLDLSMEKAYQSKIDAFVLVSYFDFLGRLAYSCSSYKECRKIQSELWAAELEKRTKRVHCESKKLKVRLISFLMSHRCYGVIWLIRKVKHAIRAE